MSKWTTWLGRLPFGLILVNVAACAVNPATGQRQLMLISESREVEMGREADVQVTAAFGLYDSEEIQTSVRDIGSRLAAQSERPQLPWSFKVVDDPIVNAFALPGGFIFVTRGIMASLNSEAELAGVLGHEIGHVTARHSASQLSRQQLQQIGLGGGSALSPDIASAAGALVAGFQLLNLKYSRGDESQSDELGVRYMSRARYDPNALLGVFRTLALSAGGGGRLPEWQSTHPDPENREAKIAAMISSSGQDYSGHARGRDEYLRLLDGMVYGTNPREGFFEGTTFRHPDMAFALDFPTGWRTVNQKTQVGAVAPGDEALVLLTLESGSSDMQAALSRFLAQDGIRGSDSRLVSVDGMEALEASFEARTESSTLRGAVLFVVYNGSLFRIIGYGSSRDWLDRESDVLESLRSFRRERDPDVLSVQPARLEIVRVPSRMTFRAFAEAYPSSVEPEKLASLNRRTLEESIEAGTLLKRVVGGRSP